MSVSTFWSIDYRASGFLLKIIRIFWSNPCPRKAFGRSGREFSAILGQNSQIKKKRKNRTAFTTYQLNELEKRFNYQKYLTPSDRDLIAEQLGLTSTQVSWTQFFHNESATKKHLETLFRS